jgi:nitrogen regulatory protein PII
VEEVTFYDIRGRGHTKKEPVAVGKGVLRDVPEFGSWIKMEAVVSDEMAGHVIQETLASIGIVGSATDGKIVVCDIAAEFELGDAPP